MQIVDKFRDSMREYIVPGIAAAGLAFGTLATPSIAAVKEEPKRDSLINKIKREWSQVQSEQRRAEERERKRIREEFNRYLKKQGNEFQKAIADGKFSEEEQLDVLIDHYLHEKTVPVFYYDNGQLLAGNPLYQRLQKEMKELGGQLSIPEEYQKLNRLLNKNLYQTDFGTPELEKWLKKRGLDVEVEKSILEEVGLFLPPLPGLCGILYLLYREKKGRSKKRKK